MKQKKLNFYLSLYQAVGFSLVSLVFTIMWIREGGMAVYLIFFMALLFLPFLLLSISELLKPLLGNQNIKLCIYLALVFLVIPALALPFFFELGGFLIAVFCVCFAGAVGLLKDWHQKLLVINVLGGLILSAIIVYLFWSIANYMN
ncbi:hypothetical protein [Rufibacter tibetensis]|uniref:Uncharacterized protein n=1 Tax=Rufibacter tibetensis TaxID=512763 RepID=A0A0P0CHK3_9BACT|nr:hypothetical protein [Rufibacter tibetensis]ALI98745.1 hypothetical protein DC20_06915 [Rufibacter tibetensis]